MSSTRANLQSISPSSVPSSILVGNGASLPITHTGTSSIPTSHNALNLNNVLLSPNLIKNLVSVRALTHDNAVTIEFDSSDFSIKDLHTKEVILRCESNGDLCPLRPSPQLLTASSPIDLWHQRLGHPGHHVLPSMLASFDFSCNKSTAHVCTACQLGKHTRLSFTSSVSVTYFPFQLLHADVWTSPIASVSGFQFYLVILDDYSHYVWTFPLQHKSDITPTLLSFHSYVCTQFQRPIVALQTDNGREFDNRALHTFLASHGVSLRFSCP